MTSAAAPHACSRPARGHHRASRSAGPPAGLVVTRSASYTRMTEPAHPLETTQPKDRIERIPLGLRWINDAFDVSPTAAGFGLLLVDMTKAKAALRMMRDARIPATITHF